jgi:hypothetical protein
MAGDGPSGRYVVDLVSQSGRYSAVEFRVRLDVVEVWHCERCTAAFDREVLRAWLGERAAALVVDEVIWTPTGGGELALVIGDVGWWALPARFAADLRSVV